jgi:hypothetical protein
LAPRRGIEYNIGERSAEFSKASTQPPWATSSNTLLPRRGLRPLATAGEVIGLE